MTNSAWGYQIIFDGGGDISGGSEVGLGGGQVWGGMVEKIFSCLWVE